MLIKPACFQREGEMEKAITAEIQQLQRSVVPLLLGTFSVHMKLPASTFRGLLSQKTISEPNCKECSNLPVESFHLQIKTERQLTFHNISVFPSLFWEYPTKCFLFPLNSKRHRGTTGYCWGSEGSLPSLWFSYSRSQNEPASQTWRWTLVPWPLPTCSKQQTVGKRLQMNVKGKKPRQFIVSAHKCLYNTQTS